MQIKRISVEYQTQINDYQQKDIVFFLSLINKILQSVMRLEIYGANKLNFAEFNISGDGETIQRCDKDSLYMDAELFNLFSECFESSNNLYDYFGPTKYNARHIIVLLNSLKANVDKITKIDSFEGFVDFAGSKFLGSGFVMEIEKIDKNWQLNWQQYKQKLISINQQLINLINRCVEEERILWLIGY